MSELIHDAQNAPQTITKHGEPVAVVLSAEDYQRLSARPKPLIEILRSAPVAELDLARDQSDFGREVDI